VIWGAWVPFLKELAERSQTAHSMNLDIDVLLRAKARERRAIDRIQKLLSERLVFGSSARRCLGSVPFPRLLLTVGPQRIVPALVLMPVLCVDRVPSSAEPASQFCYSPWHRHHPRDKPLDNLRLVLPGSAFECVRPLKRIRSRDLHLLSVIRLRSQNQNSPVS
jgi:hypothetical protein